MTNKISMDFKVSKTKICTDGRTYERSYYGKMHESYGQRTLHSASLQKGLFAHLTHNGQI